MANKYYAFNSKNSLSTLAVYPVVFENAIHNGDWSPDGGRYIHNHLIFGDYPKDLCSPVDFIEKEGKKLKNVVEMRYPGAFLISDFLKDIFEKAGLTGWKTYDVMIHRKNGDILPGFYGFSITGRNPSPNIGNTPEIPDFFMLHPDKLWIICTQRVVDVLKENKIRDFETEPLSEDSLPDVYQQINFPK